MMRNLNIYVILGISFFLLSCSREDNTLRYEDFIKDRLECMNMPRPEGSYNYPVYPGMTEWANFKTGQEMVDACQVPIEVLKKQSTHAVIQAIWEYPLCFEAITIHNYFQQSFEGTFFKNNAYNELTNRFDAGKCLLERYMLVNPTPKGAMDAPLVLELLFSQSVFLSLLNEKGKIDVVKIAFEKDHLRQNSEDYAGSATREITWLLMGRTMSNASYTPFTEEVDNNEQLRNFLQTSMVKVHTKEEYNTFFQHIISFGENYISK